jgi:hypothetical protein
VNVYLASLAACGAVWELVGYSQLPGAYYTLLFAVIGIGLVAVSRVLGIKEATSYDNQGGQLSRLEGAGVATHQSGQAILVMALLAALLQGLSRLVTSRADWTELVALLLTTAAGGLAIALAPRRAERWLHTAGTVAMAGLSFLTLNVLIDLGPWQKLEIFAVTLGLIMLAASYVGRFQEGKENDAVSVGLWLGSLLAAGALLVAAVGHRVAGQQSLVDELALLTVTILMLATGCGLQFKGPTIIGGTALGLYLAVVIVQLAYSPQVAIGVYLAIGGAVLFAAGVALSMYRDRLLALPEKIAKREGLFRVIAWR